MKRTPLLTVRVQFEQDVVTARGRAKQLAEQLHFGRQAQTCFATAVSELARNALRYAGGGTAEYLLDFDGRMLYARVRDQGPGIAHLDQVLAAQVRSETGLGLGLAATRRLMDSFEVKTAPGKGTCVDIGLRVPPDTLLNTQLVNRMLEAIVRDMPAGPLEEVRAQNQELLAALTELAQREEQLQLLNHELEDTNRGVVALYSELEEKAERLREASHTKSMFLSYMSHEFRTPLNSILGLTRLLQEEHDGGLTPEQHKQVTLTQGAARELLEMVNDLLDIAKVEAGKSDVHLSEFAVGQVFATLRALFQPLLPHTGVSLVFEEETRLPPFRSDEGKVRQILRNYIANALKFTSEGQVKVGAQLTPDGRSAELWVTDTGIGIAEEDLGRLFQDFTQVVHPLQPMAGTGLGLSLSHKFARLLGGQVSVQSTPGRGSRFSVTLPLIYAEPAVTATPAVRLASPILAGEVQPAAAQPQPLLLLIDDAPTDRFLMSTLLKASGCDVEEVDNGVDGLELARTLAPTGLVLDLAMPGLSGTQVLRQLRDDELTRELPVIVVSSQALNSELAQLLTELSAVFLSKQSLYQEGGTAVLQALQHLTAPRQTP